MAREWGELKCRLFYGAACGGREWQRVAESCELLELSAQQSLRCNALRLCEPYRSKVSAPMPMDLANSVCELEKSSVEPLAADPHIGAHWYGSRL